MDKTTRGFTLIELLITISIIAVLSAIGLVIYSSVVKQGRDSKRQSDLRSIQSALEQYYADQLVYPAAPLPAAGSPLTGGGRTYLSQMPADPNPSNVYLYELVGTSYCLYAKLEDSSLGRPSICTNAAYTFAVTSP